MTERKKLIEINYITDFDTPMYRIGETDFGYSGAILQEYIAKYGSEDLLGTLNYFIYEVIRIQRDELNGGMASNSAPQGADE